MKSKNAALRIYHPWHLLSHILLHYSVEPSYWGLDVKHLRSFSVWRFPAAGAVSGKCRLFKGWGLDEGKGGWCGLVFKVWLSSYSLSLPDGWWYEWANSLEELLPPQPAATITSAVLLGYCTLKPCTTTDLVSLKFLLIGYGSDADMYHKML